MTLIFHPLPDEGGPDGLRPVVSLRGVAIHWRESPEGAWLVQRIGFPSLSPSHEDAPPSSAAEWVRIVCAAYVLAASYHPIPSDADIFYEIRW